MLAQEKRTYSPAEYLAMEVKSTERNAFIDGEIILMSRGTPNHNKITENLHAALHFVSKGKPYRLFVSDQPLWISQRRTYTYTDVMIVAGELEYAEGRRDTITHPCFIAEILPKSTQNYDSPLETQGDLNQKFAANLTIPSFREYLLICQFEQYVELYSKADHKQWIYPVYEAVDESVSLSCLPFTISLLDLDLYDKVNFASAS